MLKVNMETLSSPLKIKKRAPWLQKLAKAQVLNKLQKLTHGQLTLIDGHERHQFGRSHDIRATITVNDAHFYGEVAFGGSIGAGEAYMLGYWQADNLTHVIRLFAANQSMMDTLEGGFEWLSKPILKALHYLNRNTQDGSRKK